MKKYITPATETLSFASAEAIGAEFEESSKTFNDGELDW